MCRRYVEIYNVDVSSSNLPVCCIHFRAAFEQVDVQSCRVRVYRKEFPDFLLDFGVRQSRPFTGFI